MLTSRSRAAKLRAVAAIGRAYRLHKDDFPDEVLQPLLSALGAARSFVAPPAQDAVQDFLQDAPIRQREVSLPSTMNGEQFVLESMAPVVLCNAASLVEQLVDAAGPPVDRHQRHGEHADIEQALSLCQ